MNRITTIDFARGVVMIIMALDHTRDLLYINLQDPTNLATTTPILFFTRWITHFCAPTFVFLSGVSAYLSLKNRAEAGRRFLLTRGIWLVLLEFTVVNVGLWSDLFFRTLIFEVIATIGCGFIILSFLTRVSPRTLGIAGLVLIFGLGLFSSVMLPNKPILQFIGSLLMGPGVFPLGPNRMLIIAYPILPWLGIMLAGFGCGRIFELSAAVRKKIFLRVGLAALGLFIVLRYSNLYGNPTPWSVQKNALFTFLSFINYSKYPPSLLFDLVTLGCLLLLLAAAEGQRNRFISFASVYGKTPLFYFLIHLYVIHLAMFIMVFCQGYHPADLVFGPFKFGRPAAGSGITLPYVYAVWLGVVVLMYPLCRRYGSYKKSHPEKKWLRYL